MQNSKPQLKSQSDLKVRAYSFSINIIKFIKDLPNQKVFWIISDQLILSYKVI